MRSQLSHINHFLLNLRNLACFDSLSLSYAQPLPEWEYNGNAEQVGYRVQYSRVGSQGRALIHVVTDRLEREFTIEDLEEWTEYEVSVQAVNGIGAGPWSQPVRGRTRESGESATSLSFSDNIYRRAALLKTERSFLCVFKICPCLHKQIAL